MAHSSAITTVLVVLALVAPQRALAGFAPWQEDSVDDFRNGIQSWSGTTSIQPCLPIGFVLGGHCNLGRNAVVSKTYTELPTHKSLLVELTYVYTNTWDDETGIVKVDSDVVWSEVYSARDYTTFACSCVRTHSKDVQVFVAHTADQVTIEATSTVDQSACDEGWGIANVRITPINGDGGVGSGPLPDDVVDFTSQDDIKPFIGLDVDVKDCANAPSEPKSRLVVTNDDTTDEAFLRASFVGLKTHNGFRAKFKLNMLHAAGRMTVTIRIGSTVVWQDSALGSGGDACSANVPSFDIDETVIGHEDDSIAVEVTATVDPTTYFGVRDKVNPVFVVYDASYEVLSLGSAAMDDRARADDFAKGAQGWFGPFVDRGGVQPMEKTECQGPTLTGTALGSVESRVVNTYMRKTYTSLPPHVGAIVSFTFVHLNWNIGSSHVAFATIDGTEVWTARVQDADVDAGNQCGENTKASTVSIFLPEHKADQITLRLSVKSPSQFSSLPFALLSPRVRVLNLAGDMGTSELTAGPQPLSFASISSWASSKATIETCSGEGTSGARVTGIDQQTGAYLAKVYTGLDDHSYVRVRARYYFMQVAGTQEGALYVAGQVVWRAEHSDAVTTCTKTTYYVDINVVVEHSDDRLDVMFTGTQQVSTGSFLLHNLVIETLTLGSAPWEPVKSDFSQWPDGWTGTSGRQECSAPIGTILGGFGFLGQDASVSKTYTNLKPHTALRIQAKYFFIHTWDSEDGQLFVDDVLRWRMSWAGRDSEGTECGGRLTAFEELDVVIAHTADSVTLRFTSTLQQAATDEAFGIQDVLIIPFTPSGKGQAPLIEDGTYDFANSDHRESFAGAVVDYVRCEDAQPNPTTALVSTASEDAPIEAFVLANFTELDSHNSIQIQGSIAPLHTSGTMLLEVFVDGRLKWQKLVTAAGSTQGCGPDRLYEEMLLIVTHSEPAVSLHVIATLQNTEESSNAVVAKFALRDFSIALKSLGTEEWQSGPDMFDDGTAGWLGADDNKRTTCQAPYGTILGGAGINRPGDVSVKTYTNIESHTALGFTTTYLHVGWGSGDRRGTIMLDQDTVYSEPQKFARMSGKQCGVQTTSQRVFVILPQHTADSIKVTVGSTGNEHSQESFGIFMPQVIPFDPRGSTYTQQYSESAVDTFENGQNAWSGVGPERLTCADIPMLKTEGDTAILFKQYTSLPNSYSVIQVTAKVLPLHTRGKLNLDVVVGSTSALQLSLDPSTCSSDAEPVDVVAYIFSSGDSVMVQFWGTVDASSNSLAAFAITEVSVRAIENGRIAWSPGPSDFSVWSDGWSGTSLDRTNCGDDGFGWILGGHNQLGANSMVMKTYTGLDSHNSIRLELIYIAFNTWDNEEGLVYVDDKLVWRSRFRGTEMPDESCGIKAAAAFVSVVVPHTDDEVTIKVSSTLNQGAADESFGIADVVVIPFTAQGGSGSAPFPSSPAIDFGDSDQRDAWTGQSLTFAECGDETVAYAEPQPGVASQYILAQFTDLPEDHNAVHLKLTLLPRVPQNKRIRMLVTADSVIILDQVVDGQGLSACDDGAVIDTTVLHTGSQFRLEIRGSTTSIDDSVAAAFAVRSISIQALTLGKSQYMSDRPTSDFSQGPDGWLLTPQFEITECEQPVGFILGGETTRKVGTYAEKTYTGLVSHNALDISLKFVYYSWADSSKEGQVWVDGQRLWSLPFSQVSDISKACDVTTGIAPATILLAGHRADEVTIRVQTTQEPHNNERFGIVDVAVSPLNLAGQGQGFFVADKVEDLSTTDVAGWQYSTEGSGTTCNGAAALMVMSTSSPAVMIKQYANLEEHDVVRFALHVASMGSAETDMAVTIIVDSRPMPSQTVATSTNCDDPKPIEIYAPHRGDTVTIEVRVAPADGSDVTSFNPAGVIVSNIVPSALTLGSAPWRPGPSDFTMWSDGFSGTSVDRSNCGELGVVLGGHNILARGAFLQKQYTALPAHNSLRISFKFVGTNTWDSEDGLLKVDGATVWQQALRYETNPTISEACGLTTYVAEISLTVQSHVSDTVTLRFETTLDQSASDESFGILDVIVTPFNMTLGNGIGPFPTDGIFRFNTAEERRAWSGYVGSTADCERGTVLVAEGDDVAYEESSLSAVVTQMPPHNALMVKSKVKHAHMDGKQTIGVAVDTEVRSKSTFDAESDQDVSTCPAASNDERVEELMFYTLHTGDRVNIDVVAELDMGATSSDNRAKFSLSSLQLSPMFLGEGEYDGKASDFSVGPDGWLAAGNLQRTECDSPYGWVLGGTLTSAVGSKTTKTFTDIGSHSGLVISMTVVYFNWNLNYVGRELRVFVDGKELWNKPWEEADVYGKQCNGEDTAASSVFIYLPAHTGDKISVMVTADGHEHNISPFGITNVRVVALDPCSENQYEKESPTFDRPDNRVCEAVTTCDDDEYEARAPTSTSNRVCKKCQECPRGTVQVKECTDTSDFVCEPCGGCEAGDYISRFCTATSDTVCDPCHAQCQDDEFEETPCTETSNRVCKSCKTCGNDEWRVAECTSTSNTVCQSCTPCSDFEFEQSPCNATVNRICNACKECSDNEYVATPCTATSNTLCKKYTECKDNEYQDEPPTRTSDRMCKPFSDECDPTQWESVAPTPTSDRVCSRCSECPDNSRETAPCTATSDRQCAGCKVCEDDEYEAAPCDGTNDRLCKACSTCDPGTFEFSPCSGFEDRDCRQCRECGDDEYEEVPCTPNSNRVCEPLTECKPDEYEQKPATPTSDRVCRKVTECGQGQYMVEDATPTSNRVCKECDRCAPDQYVQAQCGGSSNTVCQKCDVCQSDEWIEKECTRDFSQNRVCQPCTPCVLRETYEALGCANARDRVCSQCDECDLTTHYILTPCTLSSNTVCRALTDCKDGEFLETEATSSSDRICTPFRVCSRDEYETKAPTPSSDRQCTALTQCDPQTEFESKAATKTADRKCKKLSTCPNSEGKFISIPSTGTEDNRCGTISACEEGWTELAGPTPTTNRVCQRRFAFVFDADYDNLFAPVVYDRSVAVYTATLEKRLTDAGITDFVPGSISFEKGSVLAKFNLTNPTSFRRLVNSPALITMPFGPRGGELEPVKVGTIEDVTGKSSDNSALIGAIVGAVVGVLVIAIIAVFVVKRRSNSNDLTKDAPTRSTIAFENPMYDDVAKDTVQNAEDEEGAYSDLPFNSDDAMTSGYMDVDPENDSMAFKALADEESGYMDVHTNDDGEADAGYMDVTGARHTPEEGGYMDVNAAVDDDEDIEL